MVHKNEALLRQAYALFARGDLDGFYALCSPDITFEVPVANAISGKHASWQVFLTVLGPMLQKAQGSFREEVLRVAANDELGCVEVAQQLQREGQTYRWKAVHLYRIREGKLAEFKEFTDDQASFDQAWRR